MILDDYISIALTPLAIVICCHLISHWWSRAWSFINGNREPLSYIGIGQLIYHGGGIGDNSYWAAAWSALITDHWLESFFFEQGSLSNLIFRQGAIVVGGYLQIIGVMKFHNEQEVSMRRLYIDSTLAIFLGVLYVFLLTI